MFVIESVKKWMCLKTEARKQVHNFRDPSVSNTGRIILSVFQIKIPSRSITLTNMTFVCLDSGAQRDGLSYKTTPIAVRWQSGKGTGFRQCKTKRYGPNCVMPEINLCESGTFTLGLTKYSTFFNGYEMELGH